MRETAKSVNVNNPESCKKSVNLRRLRWRRPVLISRDAVLSKLDRKRTPQKMPTDAQHPRKMPPRAFIDVKPTRISVISKTTLITRSTEKASTQAARWGRKRFKARVLRFSVVCISIQYLRRTHLFR